MEEDERFRILAVDDLACNLLLIGMILDGLGYAYEFAENGKLALEKLSAGRFDLVLMDCMMPVMDGREAIKEMRKKPEYSGVKIICMSSRHCNGDNPACKGCRVDGFLRKPLTAEGISEVIEHYGSPCGASIYEKV